MSESDVKYLLSFHVFVQYHFLLTLNAYDTEILQSPIQKFQRGVYICNCLHNVFAGSILSIHAYFASSNNLFWPCNLSGASAGYPVYQMFVCDP